MHGIATFVRILLFACVGLAAAGPLPAGGEDPARAPEITLPDLYGKSLTIDYKGGAATLVNIWATWCLPCHDEMPQIADLVTAYKARGFRAYGIAVESGSAEKIRSFLAESPELGVNYPIVLGNDEALAKFGNVEIVPTSFLVDRDGKIVKTYIGAHPGFKETVAADIETVIAGAGSGPAPPDPAGADAGRGN